MRYYHPATNNIKYCKRSVSKLYDKAKHLWWLKPVSTLERNVLIRRIDTTTPYHLIAMLWYHVKHQLLLKKIRSFLWRKKLPWQQKSPAKNTPHLLTPWTKSWLTYNTSTIHHKSVLALASAIISPLKLNQNRDLMPPERSRRLRLEIWGVLTPCEHILNKLMLLRWLKLLALA